MPKNPPKITQNPPIVLIHGYRGSPLGLTELAHFLPDFDVYLPSLPPNQDAEPLDTYTPAEYAKFLSKWLKKHKIKHPILVGHSMGSLVAAATAEQYPALLHEKIVFLAPISTKPPKIIASLAPLATFLPNSVVSLITTLYLSVNSKTFKKSLHLTIKSASACKNKAGSRASARFSSNYSLADFHLEGRDILFLAGEKDRLIPRRATTRLARNLNAKLTLLPATGHLLNYESPKFVGETIEDFINKT